MKDRQKTIKGSYKSLSATWAGLYPHQLKQLFGNWPQSGSKDWAFPGGNGDKTSRCAPVGHGAIGLQNSKDTYSYSQVPKELIKGMSHEGSDRSKSEGIKFYLVISSAGLYLNAEHENIAGKKLEVEFNRARGLSKTEKNREIKGISENRGHSRKLTRRLLMLRIVD